MLPDYALIAGLGGINIYCGLILPGLRTAFGAFLLRQFFLTIPTAMLEAAELDGAGHLRPLWSVVVPISHTTVAPVALVSLVAAWLEFILPHVHIQQVRRKALPVGLPSLPYPHTFTPAWYVASSYIARTT